MTSTLPQAAGYPVDCQGIYIILQATHPHPKGTGYSIAIAIKKEVKN